MDQILTAAKAHLAAGDPAAFERTLEVALDLALVHLDVDHIERRRVLGYLRAAYARDDREASRRALELRVAARTGAIDPR